jgi:hypothetical protein
MFDSKTMGDLRTEVKPLPGYRYSGNFFFFCALITMNIPIKSYYS